MRRAQQLGVQVVEQHSAYRSQRCNKCGYVCKRNRKKQDFLCMNCNYTANADYNASCNHKEDLFSLKDVWHLLRGKTFFWTKEGFKESARQECMVPVTQKEVM